MTRYGYTLMTEQSGPRELVRYAAGAERAGFDFEVMSDHFFPWLDEQGHAGYAWSMLGAVSQVTERVELMTYVTCPIVRYHPAVVAQKAATVGVLSDNRFMLGLGDKVWGQLADAGRPVVVHAGSGPVPNENTGPGPLLEVLRRHPRLTAVLAHMGAPEYVEFLEMAEQFARVHLDTTMAFTDFFEGMAPFPPELMPRLRDLGHKVLLGSDFPNIPYPYAHQLESLERLGLGEEWLRRVCWQNAAALLG